MEEKFKGLWPAMFTPVNEDGGPALNKIEELVELFISQKMDGLYILGSTGQGILFTEEERKSVTEVTCNVARGRIPVIVQVGSLTTEESIRLAKHAARNGADGISSVGPIYFQGSDSMALKHYSCIAQATDIPFFPYQLGGHSVKGDIIHFVAQLMAIPNVMGMKLTTNNLVEISAIHNYAASRLKLFSGADELLCHASLCGTVGAIGSMYNLCGEACKSALREFTNGNYQFAKRFMLAFQDVIQLVLPHIWTFFRQTMILKYGIDIGQAKAPVGNTHKVWQEEEVRNIIDRIDAFIVK